MTNVSVNSNRWLLAVAMEMVSAGTLLRTQNLYNAIIL